MADIYLILLAIALDLILGDPKWLPHPVRWMGAFISFIEKGLRTKVEGQKEVQIAKRETRNVEPSAERQTMQDTRYKIHDTRYTDTARKLKAAGIILWLVVVDVTLIITSAIYIISIIIDWRLGVAVNVIMIFYALAIRSLTAEGRVIVGLLRRGDLQAARNRLQTVVSRDCSREDEQGIIRGTIETLTENLSDGIIAPLFFAMIGGGPLALTYKAINTLDSMVGYKNEKYRDFGWFSAKADDVVNWIPARITGALIAAAAFFTKQHPFLAIKAWRRDAQKGPSPNGGIPIVTFAGARDIELGGDCFAQDGSRICIPKVGGSRGQLSIKDIWWANLFIYFTTGILYLVYCIYFLARSTSSFA
ncbi:MAG: adenosylcobinamide-phosphate synthase CbiB [Patescibacteria group bacterium]